MIQKLRQNSLQQCCRNWDAKDAAASSSKFFWSKIDWIWANLVGF